MEKIYRINKIFFSIQGEGKRVGTPQVFVRFSGCNMKCPFCDTDHRPTAEMTDGQIAAAVWVTRSLAVLAYFPFLTIAGMITGFFTGLCAQYLLSRRLIKVLNYLPDVDPGLLDEIPPLSLLREFIGGCTFDHDD